MTVGVVVVGALLCSTAAIASRTHEDRTTDVRRAVEGGTAKNVIMFVVDGLSIPTITPVATLAGCHLGVIGLPACLVSLLLNGARSARITQAPLPADAPDCPWSGQCQPPYPFALPSIHTMPLPDEDVAADTAEAGA